MSSRNLKVYVTRYPTSRSEGVDPGDVIESALLIPYSHRVAASERSIVSSPSIPGPVIVASVTDGLADAGLEMTTVDIATSPADSIRAHMTHPLISAARTTRPGGSRFPGDPGTTSRSLTFG